MGQIRSGEPEAGLESIFLNWAFDGDSLLLRVDPIGENAIVLTNLANRSSERLDTPPYTYDAALSPDGRRVLYALSRGMGFGSELWLMNRDGSHKRLVLREPAHIVTYARWSPRGDAIAYIRMPDTNIPFTAGELWLVDGDGRNPRKMAAADAGHGYPPVWSPDGRWVAFVVRENSRSTRANLLPRALESNIYLADAHSRTVRALTTFHGALTESPAWSPDGQWLVFSSDTGGTMDVWLAGLATGHVQQVTHGAGVRYPVWIAETEQ